MKILGLILLLGVALGLTSRYLEKVSFKTQHLPLSYQILHDLEAKGLYQKNLNFMDFGGTKQSLSSFKGKIVILSFWATWCEPCVEEFPSLIRLLDQFPEEVVLIAISHDDSKEEVKEFVAAFKGFRPNMVLTMDQEKTLSQALGVDKLPEGFIFDQAGKLKKKIIGIQNWSAPDAIQFFRNLAKNI